MDAHVDAMLADFRRRLRDTREDADESQSSLALDIGTSQTMITRYEHGDSVPGVRYLLKFCEHYKISADYLLGLPDSYKSDR